MEFSHLHYPGGLNNVLSQGYVLETAPSVRMEAEHRFQGQGRRGGGEEPPNAWIQLQSQPVVTSSQ